ncbi:MAG: leucine-rich repeat protein, partial [Caryophanon sp.]|nr:leucine-rich repeat protein [Caryophanon sp.]
AEAQQTMEVGEQVHQDHVIYEVALASDGTKEMHVYETQNGNATHITISDYVNGLPVTVIRARAFDLYHVSGADSQDYDSESFNGWGTRLEKITLPKTLKRIEERAFVDNSLKTLELPESVQYIGNRAFSGNQLTTLTIPNGVQHIGDYAFEGNRLTNVTIPEGVKVIGNRAFYENAMTALRIPESVEQLGTHIVSVQSPNDTIEVPQQLDTRKGKRFENLYYDVVTRNGVQEIRINGYDYEQKINTIYVPETIEGLPVTEIGRAAFKADQVIHYMNIEPVQFVGLPETIRVIGDGAFEGLRNNVIDLSYYPQLQSIGDYAFSSSRVHNSKPFTITADMHVGEGAFSETDITEAVFTEGVTHIRSHLFRGSKIQDVTIPSTVTTIGDSAFSNSALTSVLLPEGVQTIEERAFASSKLTSIRVPSTVQTIGTAAFAYNEMERVELAEGVRSIGVNAFMDNNIKYLDIPKSVIDIGERAFSRNQLTTATVRAHQNIGDSVYENNAITTVEIEDGVTTIPNSLFMQNAVTDVSFPSSMKTIEPNAFARNNIQTITLPEGLATIEDAVFMENKLQSLTIPSTVTTIGARAFHENKLKVLHVPANVKEIGWSAFSFNELEEVDIEGVHMIEEDAFWSNRIAKLTLPTTLKTIGARAFNHNKLKRIVLPPSVEQVGERAFSYNVLASATIPASVKELNLSVINNNPISEIILQGSETTISEHLDMRNDVMHMFGGLYTDKAFAMPYKNIGKPNGTPQTLYVEWYKEAKFRDIAKHWARDAIESFTDKGYINGYPDGTFKPGAPIQRKHVARILNDVFKFEATQNVTDFNDVPRSHPYYAAISAVQKAGIFSGSNGKFEPEANLTRGQLAKVLVLAAGFEVGGNTTFKDTPSTYWGTPYISTLADLAIVKGTDGFFNPNSPVTRAQFVSMTSLALQEKERRAQK